MLVLVKLFIYPLSYLLLRVPTDPSSAFAGIKEDIVIFPSLPDIDA